MTTARRAVIEEMYDPAIGCVVANETAPHRCLQHQPEPNHRNCLGVEMAGHQSTQISPPSSTLTRSPSPFRPSGDA